MPFKPFVKILSQEGIFIRENIFDKITWIHMMNKLNFISKTKMSMSPTILQDSRSPETSSLESAVQTSQPISGGLWSLKDFPQISENQISLFTSMTYQQIAEEILWQFDFGITDWELEKIISEAYGEQWHHHHITPVKHITENLYSLHLGYGPTFAFKNIALEFLPRLLSVLAKDKVINVLWASSGDTINAAHSGVKWTNIRSIFMLPSTGPSVVQRLQAVNGIVDNPNALTLLADASFDPLQDIVKRVNSPEFTDFKAEHNITSFNSINIARILAQVVYYFRAYAELLGTQEILKGHEVIFSVPSGNFGDALAGYYAKKMGLPIKKIVVATNENDMLHKFLQNGRYEPPKNDGKDFVEVTNAPSMDIAKSSNFERMLFDMVDGDGDRIKGWYNDLARNGYFEVDRETLWEIQQIFTSYSSTDNKREVMIKKFWDEYQHGIDPHTASAVAPWYFFDDQSGNREDLYDSLRQKNIPVIFLETSHVAQFGEELENKGIIVPGMHEFDRTLDAMRNAQPQEWVHYLRTRDSFDTILPDIKKAIEEILPARFN
jgi:threonine synthase